MPLKEKSTRLAETEKICCDADELTEIYTRVDDHLSRLCKSFSLKHKV